MIYHLPTINNKTETKLSIELPAKQKISSKTRKQHIWNQKVGLRTSPSYSINYESESECVSHSVMYDSL